MNLFTSFMRSVVPIVAGLALGLLAKAGLDLDDASVTVAVTSGLTAGYYALFRLIEAGAERIGWEPLRMVAGVFLGWARPPDYEQPASGMVRVHLDTTAFSAELREVLQRNMRLGGGDPR